MSEDRLNTLLAQLETQATRDEAIKSLGAMRAQVAVEPLCQILMNRRDSHAMAYLSRKYAAEALGAIGDPGAVQRLTFALEDDPSDSVKISAALALGKINDAGAVESLTKALLVRNADVRMAAAQALGQIGAAHEIPVSALVGHLADQEDAVRDNAAEILRGLGEKAVPPLIEALKHTNSTIRGAGAQLLGEIADERARDSLQEVVYNDESQWVRSRAEWALSQLPKLDALSPRVTSDGTLQPSPIQSALDAVRKNAPQNWPDPSPDQTIPIPRQSNVMKTELDVMSPDQIRELLDALDVRLANGEISEATYRKMVDRWNKRLE